MRIELNEKNIKSLGRTVLFEDTLLLSLSGSGIEFEYTGKGFDLSFIGGGAAGIPDNEGNYARIGVFIDKTFTNDVILDQKLKKIRIADCQERKTSIIRIIKLSECAMSLAGIKAFDISDDEIIRPTPEKPIKIEFIGDSITCGYGVEDPDPLHSFKTITENVTKAFAYKTASALDADYSMFSISGYGIISGYTDNPSVRHDDQLIPTFYESMGLSYDKIEDIPDTKDIPWDFSRFSPDIVVLNLGTNDDSYCQEDCERQSWFASEYSSFLKVIRKHNQKAYIVCALGLMGDRLYPTICNAVKSYQEETGDTRIMTVHLPEQDPNIGYASDYHPLESEHQKAADTLIPVLKGLV